MGEAQLLIAGLLVAVAGLSALARVLAVPYPIVLVVGDAAFGFIPGTPDVRLDPKIVLVIFLPPLLYRAAIFANFSDLRANVRRLPLSTIGLVLLTMGTVACVAHALVRGLPWAATFALGAYLRPTRSRRPRSCADCRSRDGWSAPSKARVYSTTPPHSFATAWRWPPWSPERSLWPTPARVSSRRGRRALANPGGDPPPTTRSTSRSRCSQAMPPTSPQMRSAPPACSRW
jgi:sodium/hydrogen exchanger family protein